MKKEEFLKKKEELKPELKDIFVEVEEKLSSSYTIGCCYDQENRKWKVYRKTLPDRSSVCEFYIFLETDSEDEAFDRLYHIMMDEIEMEENRERQRQLRLQKQREREAKMSEEEREKLKIQRKKEKMENMFYYNGFADRWVEDGEKRLFYMYYNNIHCRLKYIENKRAFVIQRAESKEEALKEKLKTGTEYYYMDEPEKEMLKRLDENVMANYMK
ncbi:MAG: hypothetical protein BHW06_05805 [Clostridium sp. 44_14]|nr:MAG: hypothetical protein BHW06_05805 [Clostridium sp. 44_14]